MLKQETLKLYSSYLLWGKIIVIHFFHYICHVTNLLMKLHVSDLPWGKCGNWWNTPTCVSPYEKKSCWVEEEVNEKSELTNVTWCTFGNYSRIELANLTDPVKEYWE